MIQTATVQGFPLTGWDTETHRIGQENQLPRMVCLTAAEGSELSIYVRHDEPSLMAAAEFIAADRTTLKVAHNSKFDLGVICANFPHLIPAIFDGLAKGHFSCTLLREKLLVLAESGDLEFEDFNGAKRKLEWSLAARVMDYFSVDISADKKDDCAWRTNYDILEPIPLKEWPQDAIDYAISDADWAVKVWNKQEDRRKLLIKNRGIDPFKTEAFRVWVDFTLTLMCAWGNYIDPEMVKVVEANVARELLPENLNLLIEQGILRPAQPPRPHLKAREHVPECKKKNCSCPPRMTAGEEESIDTKALKKLILEVYLVKNFDIEKLTAAAGGPAVVDERLALAVDNKGHLDEEFKKFIAQFKKPTEVFRLKYTDKTKTLPFGQLSTKKEWLEEFAVHDPVLEQYQHRQTMQKLVTTDLPRMKLKGQYVRVVHPQYDALKETGRTSSFSSKSPEYASWNCQNPHPDIRCCCIPRPGYVLFGSDYSQMELGTLAQKCFDLFGYSVLRDKINAGIDVHAYTGAQLAQAKDAYFAGAVATSGCTNRTQIGELFLTFAEGTDQQKTLYKKWRKFAKPVNLGFPGGLGPPTFVAYAKANGKVIVTVEEATLFRELWRETWPEMVDYFRYINKECVDRFNRGWDDEEKEEYAKYAYTSPLGMHRAGCDYCAAANGIGLQTPSAEGALIAGNNLIRACYDHTQGSILGPDKDGMTTRPIMFIHDEYLGEVRDDDLVHERMLEVKRIMVEGMRLITPDVTPNAKPCLMRRWNKAAEPVFDTRGRLTVWTPDKD